MKTTEIVPEHVAQRQQVKSLTCDCCGRTVTGMAARDNNWTHNHHGVYGATLQSHYALYEDSDSDEIDICHDCANWLMEQIKDKKIQRPMPSRGTNYAGPIEPGSLAAGG